MSRVYSPSAWRISIGGAEIADAPFQRIDRNASATVTLLQPPLNPIGPNGSKRRGRNASNRYFAALLVRQGGAK